MISRRIIRIKVLQTLYAYYSSPEKSINNSEKELLLGIQKTFELYHYILDLSLEIVKFAEEKINMRLKKFRPTEEELNPNKKFINNRLVWQLKENKKLNLYIEQKKLTWVDHPELISELYKRMVESDFYNAYMASKESSYSEDKKFMEKLFNKVILTCEELYEILEEKSIYWNDDIEFVISMIVKTFKRFSESSDSSQELMPLFKDEEDRQFMIDLFRKSIINHKELRDLIDLHSRNWELDRIAFMDILIMQLALCEFLEFPSIPTKVSMNEYIEISKYYSTDKSRNFINGILDKGLKDLKKDGKISKAGRGLVGEA